MCHCLCVIYSSGLSDVLACVTTVALNGLHGLMIISSAQNLAVAWNVRIPKSRQLRQPRNRMQVLRRNCSDPNVSFQILSNPEFLAGALHTQLYLSDCARLH